MTVSHLFRLKNATSTPCVFPAAASSLVLTTRAKVFVELSRAECDLKFIEPLQFYQNVSPSKELRDAASQAESLVHEFQVDVEMRKDVFEAKQHAAAGVLANNVQLGAEERRLMEKLLLDGKRAGLGLSAEDRASLTEKKKGLSQLCVEFRVRLLIPSYLPVLTHASRNAGKLQQRIGTFLQ